MTKSTLCRAALLPLGLVTLSVQAGPPLTIEDPGILDPGQWRSSWPAPGEEGIGQDHELPLLDVSYGVSENIQVAFVAPRIVSDLMASRSVRFPHRRDRHQVALLQREQLQIAFAPLYEFNPDGAWWTVKSSTTPMPDGAPHVPVRLNDWTFLADTATPSRGDEDGLSYGFAVSRPVSQRRR